MKREELKQTMDGIVDLIIRYTTSLLHKPKNPPSFAQNSEGKSVDKYELFGREVKAFVIKDFPNMIEIDVMQKEEDCLQGIDMRLRDKCPNDCGTTYVSLFYSLSHEAIVTVGALTNKGGAYDKDNLTKHGFTVETLLEAYAINPDDFETRQNGLGEALYYHDDILVSYGSCTFIVAENIIPEDPVQNSYFTYIRSHMPEVLEKCGIVIHKIGNSSVVTLKSNENKKTSEELSLEHRLKKKRE